MGIEIKTGPMPAMDPNGTKAAKRTELQEAILKMPPGSWFIVPETAGKKGRQLQGIRSGISRFIKRMKLVGIAVGVAADGSGLIVRRTGELEQRPASGPIPTTKPKATRLL